MTERLHIIGMYKSGTTWLLDALSRLPKTAGVREIDILKAVSERKGGRIRLRSSADRIEYIFGGTAWCALPLAFHEKAAFRHFMTESEKQDTQGIQRLGELDAELLVKVVRRMSYHRRQGKLPGETVERTADGAPIMAEVGIAESAAPDGPTNYMFLTEAALVEMVHRLRAADSISAAAEAFVAGIESGLGKPETLVLKAADQISRHRLLFNWQPDQKKLLIVRDGRDVAISARHYKALMSEWQMPWNQQGRHRPKETWGGTQGGGKYRLKDYLAHLARWRLRVERALKLEAEGKLLIIRYEDLRRDFDSTFRVVLDYLGVEASDQLVQSIAEQTRFEKKKKSEPGEKGNIKRKGAVEEWRSELGFLEKLAAWFVARRALGKMGYRPFGSIEPRTSARAVNEVQHK